MTRDLVSSTTTSETRSTSQRRSNGNNNINDNNSQDNSALSSFLTRANGHLDVGHHADETRHDQGHRHQERVRGASCFFDHQEEDDDGDVEQHEELNGINDETSTPVYEDIDPLGFNG